MKRMTTKLDGEINLPMLVKSRTAMVGSGMKRMTTKLEKTTGNTQSTMTQSYKEKKVGAGMKRMTTKLDGEINLPMLVLKSRTAMVGSGMKRMRMKRMTTKLEGEHKSSGFVLVIRVAKLLFVCSL